MTLLVGQRCSNGIILAADRKVLRGGEADYVDKIFEQGGVLFAFEGLTGIRDDFLLLLRSESERVRGFESLYQVKLVAEDIVAELTRRYGERLGEDAYLGALFGCLSEIHRGHAELYYVHPQGYAEAVRYRCSGHGGDYAHSLAKYLLDPEATVDVNARRAAFIVAWVSDEVDATVGGKPQVAIVRDERQGISYLSEPEVAKAIAGAKRENGD